jgi:hypothetical protein
LKTSPTNSNPCTIIQSTTQGVWELTGDEITLLYSDEKFVGMFDGNKIQEGIVYRKNASNRWELRYTCWNAELR